MAQCDVIIRNGLIADGTGKPPIRGDVGLSADRIVFVGRADGAWGAREIDAAGWVIAPGFIDAHAHSDYLLLMDRHADNKVLQGITTDIGGHCGLSAGPFRDVWYVDWWVDSTRNFHAVPWDEGVEIARRHGLELDWKDLHGFFHRLERGGIAVNYGSLAGHYVLRASAYAEPGTQPTRRPTAAELERMAAMLGEALDQGALGLSVGFQHTDPELDVSLDELLTLCALVASRNGLFTIHLRSYGDRLLSAVREALTLCERTGVRTSISHLMADGKESWGKTRPALDMIADARARGLPIYTDVMLTLQARNYMSGDLRTLLPDDVIDEAEGQWREYFDTAQRRAAVARRMRNGIANRWYKARFYPPSYWPLWDETLRVVHCDHTKHFEGKMLRDVADEIGCDAYEAIVEVLRLNNGAAHSVLERSTESDIVDVLQHPLSMVISDGNPLRPLQSPRAPNPRIYGTFPRLFGRFVRELRALPLERAVLKTTSLPAEFLGLGDRGALRVGGRADVVVFDPATIRDRPNLIGYPERYADGIHFVFVNGVAVVERGSPTGALPGHVIRRPG